MLQLIICVFCLLIDVLIKGLQEVFWLNRTVNVWYFYFSNVTWLQSVFYIIFVLTKWLNDSVSLFFSVFLITTCPKPKLTRFTRNQRNPDQVQLTEQKSKCCLMRWLMRETNKYYSCFVAFGTVENMNSMLMSLLHHLQAAGVKQDKPISKSLSLSVAETFIASRNRPSQTFRLSMLSLALPE